MKYIREGEQVPLWWGDVGYSPMVDGVEILPIPLNYLKRFWYYLLKTDSRYLASQQFRDKLEVSYVRGFKEGSKSVWDAVVKASPNLDNLRDFIESSDK